MESSEADKIIAEFMGFEFRYGEQGFYPVYTDGNLVPTISRAGPEYTSSLDALVPVWEKLETKGKYTDVNFWRQRGKKYVFCNLCFSIKVESETIQQAAAIATAKAILELKGGS